MGVRSFALALAAVLVAGEASASTMLALTLRELVEGSEVVAKATFVSKQVRWDHGKIKTNCVLRVEEVVKGSIRVGKTLSVELLGGDDGRTGMKVVGMPTCGEPGEKIVVMAGKHDETGVFVPTAMSQGWFQISLNDDGKEMVRPNAAGLELVRRGAANGNLISASAALTAPEPVGSFLDRLRSFVPTKKGSGAK